MNKLVDSLEHEDPPEADDDFEVEVTEAQQLRAEDCSRPLRLTIRDLEKKYFSFGERVIITFEEIDDYFLPFDSHLATLSREVGSKKRSAWRGVEIELSPITYKNKASETKHIFGCRVLRVPPKPEAAAGEPPVAEGGGGVPALDDEVPFQKW